MLAHLSIHNYAIVESLELELLPGMCVITGETGAGKSILLDALGLTLGDRADFRAVRPGAERTEILANFDIRDCPEAKIWLQERELACADHQCILRRLVYQGGRSRAYINGSLSPLSHLRELGELLLDIHNQHEHQSLLKPATQRRLLDEYGHLQGQAEQVQRLAENWQKLHQRIQQIHQCKVEQHAHQQLLQYQYTELQQLALQPNEVSQLESEQQQLSHAHHYLAVCQQVIARCNAGNDQSLLESLHWARQQLEGLPSLPRPLKEATELLQTAKIHIEEAVSELEHFNGQMELDPQRLAQVEQRLSTLYGLARKHQVDPENLYERQSQIEAELDNLNNKEANLADLEQQLSNCWQQYQKQAKALSQGRQKAAVTLARAVEAEIQRLGMPGGQLKITLNPLSNTRPSAQGLEQVEWLISANPGQPVRPLNKVASGGELSRISLAIQVCVANTSHMPTLVFDEVDVGIGGPTAEVVGQLLRQLGQKGQVLTVTHLPQVAAQGHDHLLVHKRRHKKDTQTDVKRLDKAGRIEEIARMLGGIRRTTASQAHAEQMLNSAQHSVTLPHMKGNTAL